MLNDQVFCAAMALLCLGIAIAACSWLAQINQRIRALRNKP